MSNIPAVTPDLLDQVRQSNINNALDLRQFAKALQKALPLNTRIVMRGFLSKTRFQEMTVLLGKTSFKAELIGAQPAYYRGVAVHGVVSQYQEVDAVTWQAELEQALRAITQ